MYLEKIHADAIDARAREQSDEGSHFWLDTDLQARLSEYDMT